MPEPDAVPLPRAGEVFFDVRGESRSMRLSWYADSAIAVFSIWQGNRCTGTFRLPFGDLTRMIETLQSGPRPYAGGHQAAAGFADEAPRESAGRPFGRIAGYDRGDIDGPDLAAAEYGPAEYGPAEYGPAEYGDGRSPAPRLGRHSRGAFRDEDDHLNVTSGRRVSGGRSPYDDGGEGGGSPWDVLGEGRNDSDSWAFDPGQRIGARDEEAAPAGTREVGGWIPAPTPGESQELDDSATTRGFPSVPARNGQG